jgi:hypothetical protein
MAISFSDTVNNTGILQQVRSFARVDANQWPTAKVVNSVNHWKDFLDGYAIGADRRFQWDNTNHTKLPEGTTASVSGQSDYAFTTDEQGNSIITLVGVSRLDSTTGGYVPLKQVDRNDQSIDLSTFGLSSGTPPQYDKIADNIIRLDYSVGSVIAAYFKFYFQRTSPYFDAADTTETTGFSPLLDRGFVIAGAYDCALTLGLKNLTALAAERAKEEQKVIQYFSDRNQDSVRRMVGGYQNNK